MTLLERELDIDGGASGSDQRLIDVDGVESALVFQDSIGDGGGEGAGGGIVSGRLFDSCQNSVANRENGCIGAGLNGRDEFPDIDAGAGLVGQTGAAATGVNADQLPFQFATGGERIIEILEVRRAAAIATGGDTAVLTSVGKGLWRRAGVGIDACDIEEGRPVIAIAEAGRYVAVGRKKCQCIDAPAERLYRQVGHGTLGAEGSGTGDGAVEGVAADLKQCNVIGREWKAGEGDHLKGLYGFRVARPIGFEGDLVRRILRTNGSG